MFTKKQQFVAMVMGYGMVAMMILSFWLGFYTVTYYTPIIGTMIVGSYALYCIFDNDRKEKESKRTARRERYYKL